MSVKFVACLLWFVLTCPDVHACASIYVSVTMEPDTAALTYASDAAVNCRDVFGNPWVSNMEVQHYVSRDGAGIEWTGYLHGSWANWYHRYVGWIAAPHCYRAQASGTDGSVSQYRYSSQFCLYGPAPKPVCPGDPSCPPTGTSCLPEDPDCQLSPIVLNLGYGGYQLTGLRNPVEFDLDADGKPDRIAWTAGEFPMA